MDRPFFFLLALASGRVPVMHMVWLRPCAQFFFQNVLTDMFRRSFVRKVIRSTCSKGPFSEGPMFIMSYVQKVLCPEGLMFKRSYVQKVICVEGHMFRRSYVQEVICSEGFCSGDFMFSSYVQKALYSVAS